MTDPDPYPISSLKDRYNLAVQAVYNRIKALSIQPVERGKISSEQLQQLDQLHEHIRKGGAIADFPKTPEIDPPLLVHQSEVAPTTDALSLAFKLVEVIQAQKAHLNPLDKYRELEEAALHGWVLPTSAIRQMGIAPRGEAFFYGCFRFDRNRKVGREIGWKVSKG